MKKIISLLIIVLLLSTSIICANAADAAKTEFDVKSGDTVVYTLNLSDVPDLVVGCDYSIYYDGSVLGADQYYDQVQGSVVNTKLEGEVRGNWSILDGVDFSKTKPIITVSFKANTNATTHITYYVRYLYDYDLVEMTTYRFTCDVKVDGDTVIDNAKPELERSKKQTSGEFINSITGKSADADVNIYEDGPIDSADNNDDQPEFDDNEDSTVAKADKDDSKEKENKEKETKSEVKETKENKATEIVASDNTEIKETLKSSEKSNGPSPYLFIILGVIVLGAGGGITAYFINKKKKNPENK